MNVLQRMALGTLLFTVLACGTPSTGNDASVGQDAQSTGPEASTQNPEASTTGPEASVPGPDAMTSMPGETFGEEHVGDYHLGPVEWTGSFNNACSPYPAAIQQAEGMLLAGLSNEVAARGDFCDACILITTDRGRSVVARVVTYGVTQGPGNIDVSSAAYQMLNMGEFPRRMRWKLTRCPGSQPLRLQFQTGANPWWTSFWVRTPSVGVQRVEVRSANHRDWFALRRESDGTLNADSGFGEGAFSLRITGMNGRSVEVMFPGFMPGQVLTAMSNIP